MFRYRIWLLEAEILGVYAQTADHAIQVAKDALRGRNFTPSYIAAIENFMQALPALSGFLRA
jgi:hypothetical protein